MHGLILREHGRGQEWRGKHHPSCVTNPRDERRAERSSSRAYETTDKAKRAEK